MASAAAAAAAAVSDPRSTVRKIIAQDLSAADFQWSLFVAALRSYRYDTVLRPFPNAFSDRDSDTKQVDELRDVAARVPALASVLTDSSNTIPLEAWQLLCWVLTYGDVKIRTRRKEDVKELENSAVDRVFEVVENPLTDRRFEASRVDKEVFFAYHGSRLDNFYSILHNGLLAHMNKNSLFGTGTYLSSELDVSAAFSPASYGWQQSSVSPEFSCVAMCEVVDHPDVKCQDRAKNRPSRAYADDSLGGKIPERYYLVQNNSVVRVKYFLLYTATHPRTPSPRPEVLPAGLMRPSPSYCSSPIALFFRNNKSALVIVAYVFLLVAVGLSSSKSGQHFVRRLLRLT
ncbi:protein mono-ADP-ribosyltransferase PARP16-like [Ornithodoros turicata]